MDRVIFDRLLNDTTLRRLFERSTSSLQLVDHHGVTIAANPALLDLFETTAAAMFGQLPPPFLRQALAATLRGEETAVESSSLMVNATSATVSARALLTPLRQHEQVIGALIEYVPTTTEAVTTVLHHLAEPPSAVPLQQLLAVASHELKTPLTSIRGFAQLLQRDLGQSGGPLPERSHRHLRTMLRQLDRLTGLVNELLDVSRIETGRFVLRPHSCDLVALLNAVIEHVAITNEHGQHEFRFHHTQQNLWGQWDQARLEQALLHLFDNASKYSPIGSIVEVTLTSQDHAAAVAIRDQGIGIPTDQLAKLFSPFARATNAAHPNFGGLGLGLYVAQRIIEGHGGQLWAESIEGHGTTFHLLLPLDSSQPTTR